MHRMTISPRQYSAGDSKVWQAIFPERKAFLQQNACQEYLQGLEDLGYCAESIPNLETLNKKLHRLTGWTVVPVPGLVDEEILWDALSKKFLPAISNIRMLEQVAYAPDPDGIHDLIGHVPLIANPVYANYMQQMGVRGNKAVASGHRKYYEILYPFAEEFPLGIENGALKLFGPALFSADGEAKFALSPKANRVPFDPYKVVRTDFHFDEFQTSYFVFDSFAHLCEVPQFDFPALYKMLDNSSGRKGRVIYAGDTALKKVAAK